MIIFYHFQLYVIQGRYRGRIIPVAFALMKNRRAPCYKRLSETRSRTSPDEFSAPARL